MLTSMSEIDVLHEDAGISEADVEVMSVKKFVLQNEHCSCFANHCRWFFSYTVLQNNLFFNAC